jgi:hypothetical protein
MAVVGDVFGLNAVYDRQVKNVENNNLENWPEGSSYGYYASNDFTSDSRLYRVDYSSETKSTSPAYLLPTPARAEGQIAFDTNSYGYFAGGWNPPFTTTMQRLDFSTDNVSLPGNDMPVAIVDGCVENNETNAYFAGGNTGNAPLYAASNAFKLDLSSETFSPLPNITNAFREGQSVSSTKYGYLYVAGGLTRPPSILLAQSSLRRIEFSTDSYSDQSGLSSNIAQGGFANGTEYGYIIGGIVGPTTIRKFEYSTENMQSVGIWPLSGYGSPPSPPSNTVRESRLLTNRVNSGYHVRGSNLGRLDFSSDVGSWISAGGIVETSRYNTVNARTSLRLSKGRYRNAGYSKRYPGSTYYKYNFPDSTWSLAPGGQPGYRSYAVANNDHAYVSREPQNYLAKFDMTIETNVNNVITYPSPANVRMTGFANKNYGYFTGGNGDPSTPTIDEKIRRIDFETDSTLELSEQLPLGRESHGTIYNENYGYLCGGRLPDTSQVQRMDFSNETMSTLPPSSNLPHITALVHLGYANSNQAGYFVGGYNRSTIFKLDFSTENASSPGNVGSATREGYTMGGEYEGYFGGGYFPGLADMKKLDYSSDTLSNTGSNPPASIYISATFNNGL